MIASVGCLTTGVDLDVRCIVLARPTKSEMLFVQIIGRGLRRAPGKVDCLILDHSDTHSRLGFVTDSLATVGRQVRPCRVAGFPSGPATIATIAGCHVGASSW